MPRKESVPSPCIHLCTQDLQGNCMGCYRSIEEIRDWFKYTDDQKREVIRKAEARRKKKDQDDAYAHYA